MALTSTGRLARGQIHATIPTPGTQDSGYQHKLYSALKQEQINSDNAYNSLATNIMQYALVGLEADLPAPGFPGRCFVATDTLRAYFDFGTSWHYTALT